MRTLASAALLLLLCATLCVSCRKADREEAAPPQAADPAPPETTSPLGPATPVALDRPAAGPASGRAPLVPPLDLGALRVRHQGCVTEPAESAARSFPERGTHRSPGAPPAVRVDALGRGVVITHDLDHACCLGVEVSTALESRRLTVVERFTGEPCRCRCGSTLRSAVGLSPGTWEVVVRVEAPGATPLTAHHGEIELR